MTRISKETMYITNLDDAGVIIEKLVADAKSSTSAATSAREVVGDLLPAGVLPQECNAVSARVALREALVELKLQLLTADGDIVSAAVTAALDAVIGVGGPADATGAGTTRLLYWDDATTLCRMAGARRRHATGGDAWDAAIRTATVRMVRDAVGRDDVVAVSAIHLADAIESNNRLQVAIEMSKLSIDITGLPYKSGRWLRASAIVAANRDIQATYRLASLAKLADINDKGED
jgi:hypothetical protein